MMWAVTLTVQRYAGRRIRLIVRALIIVQRPRNVSSARNMELRVDKEPDLARSVIIILVGV
jgi:hypothetical protein